MRPKQLTLQCLCLIIVNTSYSLRANNCATQREKSPVAETLTRRPSHLSETFGSALKFGFKERWGLNFGGDAWMRSVFEPVAKELEIDIKKKMSEREAERFRDASLDRILVIERGKLSELATQNQQALAFELFLKGLYKYSTLTRSSRNELMWSINSGSLENGGSYTGYGQSRYWERDYTFYKVQIKDVKLNSLDFVLRPGGKILVRAWVNDASHTDLRVLAKDRTFKTSKTLRKLLKNSFANRMDTLEDVANGQHVHYTKIPLKQMPEFLFDLFNAGTRVEVETAQERNVVKIQW